MAIGIGTALILPSVLSSDGQYSMNDTEEKVEGNDNPEIEKALANAQTYYSAGDYQNAIKTLNDAESTYGNDPEITDIRNNYEM